MNVDYNLYEGMKVKGVPQVVIANGEAIIEGGQYTATPGSGRFLKRGTF